MSHFYQMLIFLAVFVMVTGSVHYYIWVRAIRDASLPSPWREIATVFLAVLFLSMLVTLILGRSLSFDVSRVVTFVPYTWLGIMMLLFFGFLFMDGVKTVVFVVKKLGLFTSDSTDPQRRKLFGQLVAGATVLTVAGMATAGVANAARRPVIKRHNIRLKKLSESLDGLRIVQISDLHIGITVGAKWLEKLVAQINLLKPDIVAITGDLVDGTIDRLRAEIAPLKQLKAAHGVYFVTGNHEYYSGVNHWISEIKKMGIRVLRNEAVPIKKGANPLYIAGVDDYSASGMMPGHGQDVSRAMSMVLKGSPVVLMAHQPRVIEDADKHKVDLVLSGHTHGGQIWPFNMFVGLQQPYNKGWYQHSDTTQIYVNQGTFLWGPPMRLGTECEITELTLTRV